MDATRRSFLVGAAALGGATIGRPPPARLPPGRLRANRLQGRPAIPTSTAGTGDAGARTIRWAPSTSSRREARRSRGAGEDGRTVSLSRPFEPEQHFIRINDRGAGNSVVDYYGFMYHGVTVTHVDALCHIWDQNGMWNGRDPAKEIDTNGARFGDITAFGDGLITRGVLLDVPRHRRGSTSPRTGRSTAGNSRRSRRRKASPRIRRRASRLQRARGVRARARGVRQRADARPGLHVSCARFIRDRDVVVLGWDMIDARPDAAGHPWPVHGVLDSYGVALLDNALLEPLAQACARRNATSSCSWRCR